MCVGQVATRSCKVTSICKTGDVPRQTGLLKPSISDPAQTPGPADPAGWGLGPCAHCRVRPLYFLSFVSRIFKDCFLFWFCVQLKSPVVKCSSQRKYRNKVNKKVFGPRGMTPKTLKVTVSRCTDDDSNLFHFVWNFFKDLNNNRSDKNIKIITHTFSHININTTY